MGLYNNATFLLTNCYQYENNDTNRFSFKFYPFPILNLVPS